MTIQNFWKAVELQLLHTHTLHVISSIYDVVYLEPEVNFLGATPRKTKRAIFLFLAEAVSESAVCQLREHAYNKNLWTLSNSTGGWSIILEEKLSCFLRLLLAPSPSTTGR